MQGCWRENAICTIIAAITITIDAHAGSGGRHYLRADTIQRAGTN